MKKLILAAALVFFAFGLSAATLNLNDGIKVEFSGCADGSVSFEATGKKFSAPVKEFELKKTAADSDFTQNEDGSFSWNGYAVVPLENGYTLSFSGKEIYTSTFNEEPKLLREIRTWKTAENFFGFGEASRSVNLRNQSFTIWNESHYGDHAFLFVPFYVTDENTAVYYNAGSNDKIFFQDGEDSQVYKSAYHRIQCFVRQDSSIQESVKKFYEENGISNLLPEWAYGFIQSKYGYKSAEEVETLIKTFKEKNIPLSAVVLDLFWFEKMGDISFTAKDFSEPEKLNDFMESQNVKLVTITEPFFVPESVQYNELKSKKLLAKDLKGKIKLWRDWWCIGGNSAALFDPLGKKAPAFMADKYSDMLSKGIDGFWTDLGEPEKCPDDIKLGKYLLKDFHNYYNYYWSKDLFEGMHSVDSDRRLFIMSRSGYTGSAKFNVSIWSGDVTVSWPSLDKQLAYGVNAGISGFSYWGSDVGGFTPENHDPELLLRWYQFGAFTPVFRAHGNGGREPWLFGGKNEELISEVIRKREALTPYVYSTARETMSGVPMMRGIYWEDSKAPSSFFDKEYMFGDWILVSPVTFPASQDTKKAVWLPAGNWYDFYSMEKISAGSGKEITVNLTQEKIPVYIKEGAIIPCRKDGTDYIFVLPADGIESSFTLYADDGVTESYKAGNFSETKFTLKGRSLKAETSGKEAYLKKEFTVVIPDGKKFRTIKAGMEELKNGIKL